MKGIVLAGGTGSRLWPITRTTSKQLLPVYDKPMIFYPLSTLMLAGIQDILIITTPHDQQQFIDLLGDGSELGIRIEYQAQPQPKGLAQALIIGEKFLAGDSCLMILGDNIFHGVGLGHEILTNIPSKGAHIFTYQVADPSQYGVLTVDEFGQPIKIEEKPLDLNSNLAVTGLYFFDSDAPNLAKQILPSKRGELEITSLIEIYLKRSKLTFTHLTRGAAWLDTGNPNSLHDAATYIRVIEERTGQKIACLEEVSWRNGWIDSNQLAKFSSTYMNNSYGIYLSKLLGQYLPQGFVGGNLSNVLRRDSQKASKLSELSELSVAVVIPIFRPNIPLLLSALKSITLQKKLPDEVICVFDGLENSEARDLIKSIFPKAKVLLTPENQGQGSARNLGVSLAESSLIAFLDQDDFWSPTHIATLVSVFRQGNFAFGYSDISEVNEQGVISIDSMMGLTVRHGGNNLIKLDIQDLLFRDLMIFPTSSMVRKEAFLSVGGFADGLRGHEDDELFRLLVEEYEAHFFTGEVSAAWTKHDQGTSGSVAMSHSRLAYGSTLIEKYRGDRLIQLGCYTRFANSFIREISSQNGIDSVNFAKESLHALNKFTLFSKENGVSIPLRFRFFLVFRHKHVQNFLVRSYRKWKSLCARVR